MQLNKDNKMSIVKSNRFAALFEDADYKKVKNNDRKRDDRKRDDRKREDRRIVRKQVAIEENKRTVNTVDALNPKNFPEMIKVSNKSRVVVMPVKENMMDILLKEKVVKDEPKDILKAGWVYMQNKNNKIITTFGEEVLPDPNYYYYSDNIVESYERRINEYIEGFGEEEYYEMFLFPNYDYEYFDKLDEQYEEKEDSESEYMSE
jgi:hypothetical protein